MPMILGGSGTISSDKITVDANGKIGVGISTPAELLSVTGNIRLQTANSRVIGFNSTAPYVLNYSGGASIFFNTLGDGSQELGFDTHYSGNSHLERMRITKEGYVKKPYQPSIRLDGNAGTATIGTGQHIISSYSVAHNIGMSYSNGRITVPVAGVYAISWNIYHYHTSHARSGLLVNGTMICLTHSMTSTGTGDQTVSATTYVSLSANDYLETAIMAGYSGNYYFGSQHTYFSVALLG